MGGGIGEMLAEGARVVESEFFTVPQHQFQRCNSRTIDMLFAARRVFRLGNVDWAIALPRHENLADAINAQRRRDAAIAFHRYGQ
jgi:hypothetical protein